MDDDLRPEFPKDLADFVGLVTSASGRVSGKTVCLEENTRTRPPPKSPAAPVIATFMVAPGKQ